MISVDSGSTATYGYNALGERVEKHAGTSYTEYIFNPQGVQADASDRSTSCCAWDYLFFGARRFGKYASNETYFSHADKIHTMGTVTDYTGAVVQDAIYHPWGQEWTMAGTMMDERFASLNQRDSESSLDPTHFRMLSSYVGRWMSPDPKKGCLKNPQNHDRYAYVVNGPTGRIDPHGDQFLLPCDPSVDPLCSCDLFFGCYCDPLIDPFCGLGVLESGGFSFSLSYFTYTRTCTCGRLNEYPHAIIPGTERSCDFLCDCDDLSFGVATFTVSQLLQPCGPTVEYECPSYVVTEGKASAIEDILFPFIVDTPSIVEGSPP